MSTEEKAQILAKFFSNLRVDSDEDLNRLLSLDSYWSEIYNENRIKLSFADAAILANKCVITKVFSENYD